MRSSDEDRAEAFAALKEGAAGAGLGRRKLIRDSLLGALAPLGLLAIVPLRDLGPLPGASLADTLDGPAAAGDRPHGPADPGRRRPDRQRDPRAARGLRGAAAPARGAGQGAHVVIRLEPDEILDEQERDWAVDGIVAYSKICTHVGCPVELYEQQTHHLLCPCHQSTFDVTRDCKVIFGPAARPLPQLALGVDDEGYLVPREDFNEPVGPSFWERGNALMALERIGRQDRQRSTSGSARPTSSSAARARSSRTTGRSCWARSRSTASSSCCCPARS